MSVRNLVGQPPFRVRVLDALGLFNQAWAAWLQGVWRATRSLEAATEYNPSSIAGGATQAAIVTNVDGAREGDTVAASFSKPNANVVPFAQVTATDTVTVYFWNISGGSIDLPAGTIRVRVWRQVD